MADRVADDVLAVVPCLNEEAHLPELLSWLAADARGALVVVADGGSTDRSRAIVSEMARLHPQIVLLDNPRRIQSAAVNLATRRFGRGRRWMVRLDAHARYPRSFIDRLCRSALETGATSVVVPMVTSGSRCFQRGVAAAQNTLLGTGGAPHRHVGDGAWVEHGHHALFDLSLFMAVGGYDEAFTANEDAELDRRLIAAGGRIWLEPRAAITYFPRSGATALFRQYRAYGRGRARNLKRHPAPVRLRQMLPLAVVPASLAGGAGLAFAPWWGEALLFAVPMILWLGASLLGGLWLGWRGRSLCAAVSGPAALTMHLAWSLGFIAEALSRRPMPPAPEPLLFADCASPQGATAPVLEAGALAGSR
ncbi:glycosyltransferase family 2 protein [Novosphingobium soli]|uniref:Glycosyltransferase family 2 protein n=1 Tax=Novosphingobium soli TaxID=574956 RepID=A0ABV6CQ14_9SPHN